MTPLFVTPYNGNMTETTNKRPSTRQLLDKIPNVPSLYQHSVNGTYYGIKKLAGKRKEHRWTRRTGKLPKGNCGSGFQTCQRLTRRQEKRRSHSIWEKFTSIRSGMSPSTNRTDASIIKSLKTHWKHGLDIRVSNIRVSMLDEWLSR